MSEITFEGLRASYRLWGSGKEAIVLLHSGGSSSAQWEKIADALPAEFSIIAPDLIGFGDTDPWPVTDALTHDLQSDLTAAIIGTAGYNWVHVVGHSYGGGTAIRLAVRHPELVRSLVLIEPIITSLLRESNDPLYEKAMQIGRTFVQSVKDGAPERGWEVFIDSRNGNGTWARMSERSKGRFLSQSQQTREGFISNWNNKTTLSECRAIKFPTTIVCSEFAIPEDRRLTEILRGAISGSRYVTIAEAGHMAPLTHPGAVAENIKRHLTRVAQDKCQPDQICGVAVIEP